MVRVCLTVSNGRLAAIESSGHSGAGVRGEDVPCAAVSVLVRTVARVLLDEPDVELEAEPPQRGRIKITAITCSEGKRPWLVGVTDVLARGIKDIVREYPDHVDLVVNIRE